MDYGYATIVVWMANVSPGACAAERYARAGDGMNRYARR